ncbi:DUF4157 domain-containing protein [Actinoplanes sp. NPDC049265]|uniref:eCIS core domain-containing protein n=1 Tax=Actinoplanes sp. NPDC049265 TaxID=3363902 RepID=UPI00371273D6
MRSPALRAARSGDPCDDHAPRPATSFRAPEGAGNAATGRLLGEVESRVGARAGSGRALDDGVRAEAETVFGAPLGNVRVHDDAEAAAVATLLSARAFTVGSDVFFGAGEYRPSTPDGFELLIHELTHTRQGPSAPAAAPGAAGGLTVSRPGDPEELAAARIAAAARATRQDSGPLPAVRGPAEPGPPASPGPAVNLVRRESTGDDGLSSLIPDIVLDGVRGAVAALPGYTMLTQVIGTDPITGRPVPAAPAQLVESVLTAAGPFGAATSRVLAAADVVDDALAAVGVKLAAHRVTLARIGDEIGRAWDELSITAGVDGNAAMLARHVDGILADARAAVAELIDDVLALVRNAVAGLVEPLLRRPEVRPVWDLATQLFRHDPLRGTEVRVPTVEILAGFLTLIGREQTLAQLRERGTLQAAADWLDTRLDTFGALKDDTVRLFTDAWAALRPENLPHLLDTLPGLADRAITLLRRILAFGGELLGKALSLVKESLLGALAERAGRIPGYPLLTMLLERDPFTGARVTRTREAVILGFLSLLPGAGGAGERLAEAGVLTEAAARIEAEVTRCGISIDMITGLFRGVWDTLTLEDLLDPVAAFERVLARFGEPLGRLIEFATVVVEVLVTTALKLMNFPSELLGAIVADVTGALADIRRDPVGFLLNVMRALRLGFTAFLDGIGGHLLRGLGAWLLRGLGHLGIAVPEGPLTTGAVLEMAMRVLGITADALWEKLSARLGPERTTALRTGVERLGEAWQFVTDLREQGLSGILAHLAGQVGSLWDTLIGLATDWIMTQVVQRATTKLLSMLDPTGVMAVVNGCVAFFNAVQSAVEYLRDILQIVEGYTRTLAQVARGDLTTGAERVTRGLADAVPVAIGFLAAQVGLGNVPEKLVELIERLRALIVRAIDWLFDQAFRLGARALSALKGDADADDTEPGQSELSSDEVAVPLPLEGETHRLYGRFVDGQLHLEMASVRGRVLEKLDIALEHPSVLGDKSAEGKAMVTRLRDLRRRIAKQEEKAWTARFQTSEEREQILYGLRQELDQTAAMLQGVGAALNIVELQEDPDVRGGEVLSEFDIRRRYYGAVRDSDRLRGEFYLKMRDARGRYPELEAKDPLLYRHSMSYVCPGWNYRTPHICAGEDVKVDGVLVRVKVPVQIEHRKEVIEHWNHGDQEAPWKLPGRGTTQSERDAWNNWELNLTGMCGPCNREKEEVRQNTGDRQMTRAVLAGFKGKSGG